MAKKQRNKRLRRTIMGTFSAIFMISAIIVAAVPVKETSAANFTVSADPDIVIPDYTSGSPIFSDKTGIYRVAYVQRVADNTGVLCYYDVDNFLSQGSLTIPSEINAYQYDPDEKALRAVYEDGKFLSYVSGQTQQTDLSGNTVTVDVISPCLATTESAWMGGTDSI